ncbi:MAG: hypothetical protein ABIJ84_01690 [bacterium]
MRKPHKNSLLNKALKCLIKCAKEKSIEFLDLSIDLIFYPENIVGGLYQYRGKGKHYTSQNFSKLKNNSYFNIKNNKICLTTKGRIEIIKSIIRDNKKDKKWDGKWWAIIFDIPEVTRKNRNFLRRELKMIGLREVQKSVWIFPFDIEKELLALLKLWKQDFRGDIRFLRIEKMTEDADIKKYFGL